ncbi:MAG TPA: hypothetical protein VGE74_26975, partial [Gemmata sp.]
GERALRRALLKAAEEHTGDYFTRCGKLLKAMQAVPAAYLEAVREITRLTATGPAVSEEQFFEFRQSPAGVALELFHRGRKATPGLTADGLASIITDANVDEVFEQLQAVLRGDAADPNP